MKMRVVPRTNEINSMLEIIRNIEMYKENSKNGLVILLNGAWGTGKTTYLNDLKETIKNADDIELFNDYNAYEYDCYDNAYIPLFASIAHSISLDNNKLISIAKSTGIGLVTGVSSAGKAILNKFTGIDINTVKDDIKSSVEAFDINLLEDFKDFNDSKDYIKSKMCEVCKDSTQVFIIDELDRCKPNFAMDTLEIVKHFFDVPNCVFIIAVDKMQLEQSAKAIYGAVDSEKYFSKLFDYQFNLLPISVKDAIDISDYPINIEFLEYANEVLNILNVSIRDSKKILNELFQKSQNWKMSQSLFMLFFFILKYTDLSFYNAIINGDFEKYQKLISQSYDVNLERYAKLFYCDIGQGFKYGEMLEILSLKLHSTISSIRYEQRGLDSNLKYGTHTLNALIDALREFIPVRSCNKSLKENIKMIVG